jgi:hypothetical protein
MNANTFSASRRACGALALATLLFLSGCAGYPSWGRWSQSPTPQQKATALEQPVPPPVK